jgi:PPOX class probable F420-dependent enzyme
MGNRIDDLTDPAFTEFWSVRHLCTATTVRRDGTLHVTPMGFVLDAERGWAWGITSRGSVKARNVAAGSRLAVCQVDGRWWSSLEGTAEVLDDPDLVAEAEQRYAARYRVPRPNPQRVALRMQVATALAHLPRDVTEG